ncbi:MAG: hypothetical protein JXA10_11445 [Anaerolineae bacterium]|nr:hypothetical protein [Anaerolineae bacterium]
MDKQKYEKPSIRNLDQTARGQAQSCLTGISEQSAGNCSGTGGYALGACGGGSTPMPFQTCTNGGDAGLSCVVGSVAG